MDLKGGQLNSRCQNIVDRCEPFLVSYKGNWGHLDLAPGGVAIPEDNLFDPTLLRSRQVIDGLHHLDSFTFGDQEMLMPRWVLFDCGSFPGIVFGFGQRAQSLDMESRKKYKVEQPSNDNTFVPLSMWVAIRCAEEAAWFGHNLSSANLILPAEHQLPGLATITKSLGLLVSKAKVQYGATQWDSSSLNVHLSMGEMEILNAVTPAHTHHFSFTYKIPVETERAIQSLTPNWKPAEKSGDRFVDSNDPQGLEALHLEMEKGLRLQLTYVEKRDNGAQRLWLKTL
jgi:hypothetical protein